MRSTSINASDLFDVSGLVVVVTGGGTGIGLMIAKSLEANGAIVYIIGRRKDVLERAAESAIFGNIRPIQGDVTSKIDLERMVMEIGSSSGLVNSLICNAGINGPSLANMPANPSLAQFREYAWGWDADHFNETFAVNTTAVFNTAIAFLELLDAGNQRSGLAQKSQIIATSSIGAFNRSALAGYAYSGAKAAVVHIMKQLATSLVPYNIRANIIAPGFYPSELTQHMITARKESGWPKSIIPEERPGDIQDIAGAVLFLTSRAGAYINGNVLVTDGGRLGVVPASY